MAGGARRDGPAVPVDHLDHDQVLQIVHAGLALAAGRDDHASGRKSLRAATISGSGVVTLSRGTAPAWPASSTA